MVSSSMIETGVSWAVIYGPHFLAFLESIILSTSQFAEAIASGDISGDNDPRGCPSLVWSADDMAWEIQSVADDCYDHEAHTIKCS